VRIIIQIGYTKANNYKRIGQKVSAYVNDVECTWGDGSGKYLTSFLDSKKGKSWYLWEGDLEVGDAIRIQAFTTIAGKGVDEQKTFEMIYVVDEQADVQEVDVPGVGAKGYPLIKGRVVELGTITEADNRVADITAFLDDEKFD